MFPPSLPSRRDAKPYERLRAASDKHFHETGERPKIFLANLGEPRGCGGFRFCHEFFRGGGNRGPAAMRGSTIARGGGILPRVRLQNRLYLRAADGFNGRSDRGRAGLRAAGAARIYLAGRASEEACNGFA